MLYPLIDELLNFMQKYNKDYNNTFWSLSQDDFSQNGLINDSNFIIWHKKWRNQFSYQYSNGSEVQV